jgi:hypothetical protein
MLEQKNHTENIQFNQTLLNIQPDQNIIDKVELPDTMIFEKKLNDTELFELKKQRLLFQNISQIKTDNPLRLKSSLGINTLSK